MQSEGSLPPVLGVCQTCSSPVVSDSSSSTASPYCSRCGSNRVDSSESLLSDIVPVARKASLSAPSSLMARLFTKSRECVSFSNLDGLMPNKSSASLLKPPSVSRAQVNKQHKNEDLEKEVASLRDEIKALREDLKEETRNRFKVETLLVRVVEDLMRLRGGVVSEEVLDKKLHVATNYLDHLAQKFKLDFDLLEFGDQIASGGFSDVYTGLYRGVEPAVEVAIKKLRIDVIDPDQYFLDLEREVELLSSLSHPCILQFVGCCVWPSYYIVTELMEGGDWDKALRKRDLVLPWSLRLHVLLQIATALHYLHHLEPAIVHLDVKPLNILMGKRSETCWIAKLSDFGLSVKKSSVVTTNAAEKRLGFRAMSAVSRSGVLPTFLPAKPEPVGTPLHLAPELAKSLPFNEKADIYSFGMLIWQTCTRKSLHEECKVEDQSVYTLFTPQIPEKVPKELKSLMLSSWNEHAWNRPSISVVIDVLNDLPEDEWQ